MKFDDLLHQLGEFGPYQRRQYLYVCLPKILVGCQMVITVFVAAIPNHRCSIPDLDNDTYAIQDTLHQLYINRSVPSLPDQDPAYSKCELYAVPGETNSSTVRCSNWVYDNTTFHSTIVSQMDLVCDKVSFRSHAQMVFMGGVLIGSVVFGILADILGRRMCICIAVTLQTASGVAIAFAPEFYSLCFLRLLNGAANAALMINSFVLVTEIVGTNKRRWSGIIIMYFFTVGYILLAGLGYLIRDWKYLQIACSAPGALFLVYWWILPESPRWLLTVGKKDKAWAVLQKMAKSNGKELTKKMFESLSADTPENKESFTLIFTSRILLVRAAILFFNWMVVSMMYYGLSLNSGNLAGNIYVNFLLSGIVEIPAYTGMVFVTHRCGRRPLHSSLMITGGIACISTLFPVLFADQSFQWVTITLALIGKFCATAVFASIYIITSEIFPTVIRNGAMGGGSMCARIGGMVAPYIADLGDHVEGNMGQAVPLVTFGACALLAGFLTLALPETFNRKLPETIEDGINLTRNAKDEPALRKKREEIEFVYTNPDKVVDEDRF